MKEKGEGASAAQVKSQKLRVKRQKAKHQMPAYFFGSGTAKTSSRRLANAFSSRPRSFHRAWLEARIDSETGQAIIEHGS